jgi:thymidylate synthase (FAD)
MKNVLDKGYVRLVNYDPNSDLNIVNAARVSFLKESTSLDDRDIGLLHFLKREGHVSTMRHSQVTFEIYAPLMVARQMFKYRVGSEHTSDTSELLGVPKEHVEAVIDYLFNICCRDIF